jgi:hypothetical protein
MKEASTNRACEKRGFSRAPADLMLWSAPRGGRRGEREETMASKFQQFLSDSKIDQRRLLVASRLIERLRPEDRAIRRARKKPAEGAAEAAEKPATAKPHSGHPVTARLLAAATSGKKISGPQKTRLLRAVNHVLAQKKKDPTDLRALF